MCGCSPYRRVAMARESGQQQVTFTCISNRDIAILRAEKCHVEVKGKEVPYGGIIMANDVVVSF